MLQWLEDLEASFQIYHERLFLFSNFRLRFNHCFIVEKIKSRLETKKLCSALCNLQEKDVDMKNGNFVKIPLITKYSYVDFNIY